ncbi:hypothetical protein Ahy_A05g023883 isoform B [Arachis hypogaea]|uniref:Uncharacterized protein n=1 Tax=Arachis hypogaea TaxID=3818 RepID=A0A445D4S4_ARAHY|nr:hypothetical protein Ahy_A05g023883 isoform B [Arachis hypogaea]
MRNLDGVTPKRQIEDENLLECRVQSSFDLGMYSIDFASTNLLGQFHSCKEELWGVPIALLGHLNQVSITTWRQQRSSALRTTTHRSQDIYARVLCHGS